MREARNRSLFISIAVAVATLFFVSCNSSEDPVPQHTWLVSLEPAGSATSGQIIFGANLIGLNELADHVQYDAKIYRMVYRTSFNGRKVEASGIVGIPVDFQGALPVISMQHGTIIRKSDAPSRNVNDYLLFSAMATTGMITLIPDFLGFGESEDIFHPYYIEEWEARPVVDMIKAAVELMADSAWIWNNKLFLTGYSEGGYVTMATHKFIQEHPEEGLTVTASAPAAGGYDLIHMKDYFFSLDTYHEPFYLAYVFQAYKNTFSWNKPLTAFFQEPYATLIPGLFNGTLGGSEINLQLTEVVSDYLNPAMLETFETNPEYSELRKALMENSLTDWMPEAPMRMYHGTADITVPYDNTIATYQQLKENGAGNNLELISLEGAMHATGLIPMMKDMVPWIMAMKD